LCWSIDVVHPGAASSGCSYWKGIQPGRTGNVASYEPARRNAAAVASVDEDAVKWLCVLLTGSTVIYCKKLRSVGGVCCLYSKGEFIFKCGEEVFS